MKSIIRYCAADGTEFESSSEARAYEAKQLERTIVGLTEEQVSAALNREDIRLGDAIETLGRRIAAARIEAGGAKRERRAKAARPDDVLEQPVEELQPRVRNRKHAAAA